MHPVPQGLAKTSEAAAPAITPSSHTTTPISPQCTSVVEPDSTVQQTTTTESSKKIMQALSDKIKRNQLQKMISENTVSTTIAMDSAATILTPNSDKALLSPTTESPELLPSRLHPVRSLSCSMTSPTNDTKYRGFDVKAESSHLLLSNDSIRNDSPRNVKPKHLNNSSIPRKRTVSQASSRRTSSEVVIGKADTSHDMLQVRRMVRMHFFSDIIHVYSRICNACLLTYKLSSRQISFFPIPIASFLTKIIVHIMYPIKFIFYEDSKFCLFDLQSRF